MRKALAGHAVDDTLVARLSARQDLTPAQIHTAVRFAALAQAEGSPLDALIERQLAHSERDKVRAAYNRAEYLPERTKMLQSWADMLDAMRHDGAGKVARLRRKVAA